ncbi:hypothetical protein QOZ80_2BG0157980 [Eleusine coracana subsp. coracana]|nr:hypothetical protein QOZ80_2BG0157980 [Eleusine coracana subsp. coracana]
MQFIYVLPGWEGSAHDGRVLRDAISRPNELRVPQGCYYLTDAGYTNANGFLAPYRELLVLIELWTFQRAQQLCVCEKQQYEDHCKNHPDAKGLYGVQFPYYSVLAAIYAKDTATGEGAEDMSDAINNMEQELAVRNDNNEEEEKDRMSRETPRRSTDSTSSSSKKRKKEWKGKETVSNDPLLNMFNEVSGELKVVTKSVGKMAHAMEHEAAIQEKATSEDPKQKLRERAVNEVRRLEFTGAEVIQAALVFVKMPEQMGMLFALPEPLRRKYIVNMLRDETRRKEREERLSR